MDTIRSRQCTPRAATWLKKTATPLNPPPEINVEEFNIFFFVFQHVPATPISAGSYGRLFLSPLIFVKKDAYIYEVVYFIYSKKTSKSCIFTHGAPPCSEQSCNQAMFSRHPRATRGIASRISPPLPPKINVEQCCSGPEPTFQH